MLKLNFSEKTFRVAPRQRLTDDDDESQTALLYCRVSLSLMHVVSTLLVMPQQPPHVTNEAPPSSPTTLLRGGRNKQCDMAPHANHLKSILGVVVVVFGCDGGGGAARAKLAHAPIWRHFLIHSIISIKLAPCCSLYLSSSRASACHHIGEGRLGSRSLWAALWSICEPRAARLRSSWRLRRF